MEGSTKAAFVRGGTSKALVFHSRDLPANKAEWAPLFLAVIGSPDPYGRQLNGMGGGVSSLSKVCVVGPSTHPGADVDYTFVQVGVKKPTVDLKGNCGNMSAAIGPFAVDEGYVTVTGAEAVVRIHNTNTGKIIHSRFPVCNGKAVVEGTMEIPGVAGTGAPIKLEFIDPGGAVTKKLLPTGNLVDTLEVPGFGRIRASLVDASNACCFLLASDLGLLGTELPSEVDSNPALLAKLESIRLAASVAMGISKTTEEAKRSQSIPFIGFVAPAKDARTLSGTEIKQGKVNLTGRMMSSGQLHRALPLAASLCMAVAAAMEGTLVHSITRQPGPGQPLRIAMPSGELALSAHVTRSPSGHWTAHHGSFYRTQRRLFSGIVHSPPSSKL